MKAVLSASLLAGVLVLTGCGTAGITGSASMSEGGGYSTYIQSDNPVLALKLAVTDVKLVDRGGMLQGLAELTNTSYSTQDLQYKFVWFDSYGIEIDPGSRPWTPLQITGKNVRTVQALAPNPAAKTFKVRVRAQ